MLSVHHMCWRQETSMDVHPTAVFLSQSKDSVGYRNQAVDTASQEHKKPSVRGQGTPRCDAKQSKMPAPRCWGAQLWLAPGENLPHVFPMSGWPMTHHLLSRGLAMGSFPSWLSGTLTHLSKATAFATGCNAQDSPRPPRPTWVLWVTAGESPLFHKMRSGGGTF